MNLFTCCLLFVFVKVFSSEEVFVCQSVSSSNFNQTGGKINIKKTFLYDEETQKWKGDVDQKENKGNYVSTGEKGTKRATGDINTTEMYGLKLQLELGKFHEKNF